MRIVGIDPGSRITGYGVIELQDRGPRAVEAGAIRLDCQSPIAARLVELHGELCDLLDGLLPDRLAVEKLYSHYRHPQTAVLMGHARGVILLAAAQRGIPVEHFGATQIKKHLTGRGRAGKRQVQRAVAMALSLPTIPDPPDVADALAVALCCAHHLSIQSALATVQERP